MPSVRPSLRLALLLCLAMFTAAPLHAQISVPATPPSFDAALPAAVTFDVPARRLEAPSMPEAQSDAFGLTVTPIDPVVGLRAELGLGLDNAGTWTDLPDGGRLWRLRVVSEGAPALHLIYDDFWLPPGAQLFLYDDDRNVVLGAFTEQNNKPHGGFATDFVPGEATTLEYYEPASVPAPGRLRIGTLMHAPASLGDGADATLASDPYNPIALPCSINVACPEGDGLDDAINAVVRIGNACTGVLLNNTREDGTPYLLTANHCGSPAVGDTLNWVIKIGYQSDTCADPAETPSYYSVSGGIARAVSQDLPDYTLVELLEPIPAEYGVNLAGWSLDDTPPSTSFTINHPQADIKKITRDDDTLLEWNSQIWFSIFDHGSIETGSSGAPLFNEQQQVIGHLHGVWSYDPNACSGPGGDDNNAQVLFPKLSHVWNHGTPGNRVSDYLDPDGTGTTNLPPLSPSSIWINEINADAGAPETTEFVEVVGPPGTDLTGYTLDVYSCSGGTATLQQTETIGSFVLPSDYGTYGIFVLGGSALAPGVRDQQLSADGLLPDGDGLIVLKDDAGNDVFDFQYGGSACPASNNTRSAGDAPGLGSMGFTMARPSASEPATDALTATPGQQNFDGGQELPVELTSFEALLDGAAVLLQWTTASETNNAGFEVQHRPADDDRPSLSEAWTTQGYVEGHGTTIEARSYTFRLEGLAPGRHVFRLKQLDYDGTFEYHPEVEVHVGIPSAFVLTDAYPNPFNPQTQFSLSVARAQQVEVAVFDVLGRRVARLFEGELPAASSRALVFDGAGLPSGLYLIRVVGEYFAESQTVTLLK